MNGLFILLLIILPPTILTYIFIHMNYKKYPVISTLNEIMLFKKMLFNKKFENCAGKKTTASYFFLTVGYVYYYIVCILDILFDLGKLDVPILLLTLLIPIIRLIYEYVIIPIAVSNNGTVNNSQNTYIQHPLQQNNVTTSQTDINTQSQQTAHNPLPTDNQFKFCTQCGTCYNALDSNCPNCGMQ